MSSVEHVVLLTLTSVSLDNFRKSSSFSNLFFWSVTTRGIWKMNRGSCSKMVGVSNGSILYMDRRAGKKKEGRKKRKIMTMSEMEVYSQGE